jgi:hypothetical protein
MILQILNIVGGAIVASGKMAELFGQERVASIKNSVAPYESRLGLVLIVIGLIGLLERLGIFNTGLRLGSSFPQVIPLIAIGLLLAAPLLEKYPSLKKVTDALQPYSPWIGLAAIACGLGSLLFGCVFPICYPLAF